MFGSVSRSGDGWQYVIDAGRDAEASAAGASPR
jgi:hypothetical protein